MRCNNLLLEVDARSVNFILRFLIGLFHGLKLLCNTFNCFMALILNCFKLRLLLFNQKILRNIAFLGRDSQALTILFLRFIPSEYYFDHLLKVFMSNLRFGMQDMALESLIRVFIIPCSVSEMVYG